MAWHKCADDKKGAKLAVRLADGLIVETVIINHRHASSGRERNTVCVSSQVRTAGQSMADVDLFPTKVS
jgi:adenine C2-methylase RlmN of 23S rRNA A2503 and tRNA A37